MLPRPKLVPRNRRTHWISPKLAMRVRKDKGADFSLCDVNIPVEVK